jgi:hypothetical protein
MLDLRPGVEPRRNIPRSIASDTVEGPPGGAARSHDGPRLDVFRGRDPDERGLDLVDPGLAEVVVLRSRGHVARLPGGLLQHRRAERGQHVQLRKVQQAQERHQVQ